MEEGIEIKGALVPSERPKRKGRWLRPCFKQTGNEAPPVNSKFTNETRFLILDALRRGVHYSHAAQAANVCVKTFSLWMKRGWAALDDESNPIGPDAEYGWFLLDCKKAESEAVLDNFQFIRKAADGSMVAEEKVTAKRDGSIEKSVRYFRGDWQAAAWMAERVHDVYKQTRPDQAQIANRDIKIQTIYVNDWRGGQEAASLVEDLNAEDAEAIDGQFSESPAAMPSPESNDPLNEAVNA